MSILVTGGTGAIGSWVSRMLVEQGHETVALDVAPNTTLLDGINQSKLKIVRGDVTDLAFVLDTVKKHHVATIIHTAALILDYAQSNPALALRVNCDGTMHLLEAARLFDVGRLVFTSTGGVLGPAYGEYGHPIYKPTAEDRLKNPNNMYSYTKLMCEGLGMTYRGTYGVDFVALRFKSLYGPMRYRHGPVARVDKMVLQALQGEPIQVPKNGEIKNDWTYNKDCAKALLLASLADKLGHPLYHIGTGIGTSLNRVAEIIQGLIPGSKISTSSTEKEEIAVASQAGVMDYGRAEHDFAFKPDYPIEEGLKDYLSVLDQFKIDPTQ